MAIQASPPINNMLFVLIGERLIQANEDLARGSHAPYRKLARNLEELSDLIEKSIGGAARALPAQAGQNYVRAMRMFVDEGGAAHLKQFSKQLDDIADGRVRTSYQIMETKWQIIAEVIRLMVELIVVFALSVFSGGAAAGRAAVAKARSRVAILTLMDQLSRRTHVLPVLSEALEEAFQSFAVRLGMLAFTAGELAPKGFDWKAIAADGVIGGFAGAFMAPIAKGGQSAFDGLKRGFKGSTPVKNVTDDILPKVGAKTPPRAVNHTPGPRKDPAAGPTAPPRGQHLSGGSQALGEAGAESVAEFLGGGLMYGHWSTSWSSFVGAGLSNRSEHALHSGAVGSGTWINTKFSSSQHVGPVNGPDAGLGAEGEDEQHYTV
ncbi:WXG100-like domain-containing protein, partial [Streptomyces sp. NPDC002491]